MVVALGHVPPAKFLAALTEATKDVKESGNLSTQPYYAPASRPSSQSGDVLKVAFADAQRKAAILAAAAHRELGGVEAIAEEVNGIEPIARPYKGMVRAAVRSAPGVTLSPDAPVVVDVVFRMAGAADTIEVAGIANPPAANRDAGSRRTDRVAVNISGNGAHLDDAMRSLKAYEALVRSTAASFGLGDASIELEDVGMNVTS
jgi:hypothetical protein